MRLAAALESEIATSRIRGRGDGHMESIAEQAPATAVAGMMPRFADGTINMQELL